MKTILCSCFFLLILSVARAQTGSEIWIFDVTFKDAQVILSNGKNFTQHKGYDNQPFFHPEKSIVYYSSFDDSGRADLKYYDYVNDQTAPLTQTREREYSPTVTPDQKYISCIIQRDNGAQDLGKYPITGGDPIVLINDLTIGYHAWAGNDQLILFVLGKETNSLHYYNLTTRRDTILADNIGRSLHKIPGENALSFVQRVSAQEILVKKISLPALRISTIIPGISPVDHLAWIDHNRFVMPGENGLSCYNIKEGKWEPVKVQGDASQLKGMSRLAFNFNKKKMAIVVSE